MAAADAALYRAKACGRDQVQMISTTRGLSAVSGASRGINGAPSTAPPATLRPVTEWHETAWHATARPATGPPRPSLTSSAGPSPPYRGWYPAVFVADGAGTGSTAAIAALAVWHCEVLPVLSTSGVGSP